MKNTVEKQGHGKHIKNSENNPVLSRQSGFSMVEVLAAGAILLMISLLGMELFSVSGRLMNRGEFMTANRKRQERAAELLEKPDSSLEREIRFTDGENSAAYYAGIDVYGNEKDAGGSLKVISSIRCRGDNQ